MSKHEYVSLHNHSDCSLLDGLGTIDEYVARIIDLKQKGLGLTDHGNGHGLFEFMQKTKSADIIGVPGVEFYMAPENPLGAKVKEPVFYSDKTTDFDVASGGKYLHLTVWAYTEQGLHNLFNLLSLSNHESNFYMKPRIDTQMLFDYADGLIVSTGCPSSEVSTRLLLGQDDKALEYAGRLLDVFGKDRLFVEIMNHHMPGERNIEKQLLPKQLWLQKKLGLKLLATNDSHYANPHDHKTHEEFLCMQSGAKMSDKVSDEGGKRFAFSGTEYYLRSTQEMNALFPDKDFPGAIKNTLLVAEMASELKLSFNPHLKPVPQVSNDLITVYKNAVLAGLRDRYGDSKQIKKHNPALWQEIVKRHEEELETIYSSDFMGYMLVVQDYIKHAKDKYSVKDNLGNVVASSVGVARGSVAGSLHAYALGISDVDPIKHNLLFSRFLSSGRGATGRIYYDDGSTEDSLVSDVRLVMSNSGTYTKKYVHELCAGDNVVQDI